ncbi:protein CHLORORESPIRATORY REDUCTION 41, chloroplastic [Magnolia sinica]|uniref:protein CHLORORESPIRATORY REDUCTION 41, chloroplastic n=1 Tax=Magnolia sinica TaxID=86752 RepID=UPI002658873C|nr:protein CHLORORESPIRATORY REDUCTION 41, chloroplastic [Magnolia sinica]
MASSPTNPFQLLPHPKFLPNPPLFLSKATPKLPLLKKPHPLKCAPNPNPAPENTQLETQKKSDVLKKPKSPSTLSRPEPPNFEIGWKRTKEIKLEKPKGWMIMDFLEKLEGLMVRREYGSTKLLAKVGEIVSERAREEAEVLREGGEVEERLVTELGRVLRLMEMDLEMVRAAVKEETLNERLEQAKARCRQAILVANSF